MAKKKSKGVKNGAAHAKSMVMQPLYRPQVVRSQKTDYKRTNKQALLRLADSSSAQAA
ncbi:hypothetical protein [Pseudomonas sp. S1(2024)]|uniref:hypothetical protein n=1 Tax=Pseudomonas sp. S1(2024) TaxID=3390191 RepID=UPI00397B5BB7